mmetsp:Transcript_42205/g.90041  ORF Transcript_42205/g.90041 Transcript_42205/m.90041 type:complete len:100 (+) Transcript_42205:304-603(+)
MCACLRVEHGVVAILRADVACFRPPRQQETYFSPEFQPPVKVNDFSVCHVMYVPPTRSLYTPLCSRWKVPQHLGKQPTMQQQKQPGPMEMLVFSASSNC